MIKEIIERKKLKCCQWGFIMDHFKKKIPQNEYFVINIDTVTNHYYLFTLFCGYNFQYNSIPRNVKPYLKQTNKT